VIESCIDCHAWGVTRTLHWLCYGCKSWRESHRRTGRCPACGQEAALHTVTGSCRLCHKQRSWYAKHTGQRPNTIALADANRGGQQLFVANTFYVHHGRGQLEYRKKTTPVDMSVLRPVAWERLTLFDSPRDLKAGLEREFLPPPHPHIAAAFNAHVTEHANRYGWTVSKTERVNAESVSCWLSGHSRRPHPTQRRRAAVPDQTLRTRRRPCVGNRRHARQLLGANRRAVVPRHRRRTPQQMRTELTVWFDVMRNGSASPPRKRPRQDPTISTKRRWAMPALRSWTSEHESLCAIGRDNVHAAIAGKNALARSTMLSGLRSIFTILKGRKMVFGNPTARIKSTNPAARSRHR
jgi:hypothetical protein